MKGTTLCLTGNEATVAALEARMTASPTGDILQEIRLDALTTIDAAVFSLLERVAPQAIVTCRPPSEGGAFAGDERERLQILARAARLGVAWIDLELAAVEAGGLPEELVPGGSGKAEVLVSAHVFEEDPGRIPSLVKRLNRVPAEGAKLALAVRGAGDLLALMDPGLTHPERVVLGMGAAGQISRLRPSAFGSAWTYLSLTPENATAPGQLDLARALDLRLREHVDLAPLALIGGPSVLRSPGPRIYNALLSRLGLPYQYITYPADSFEQALALGERLGVRGYSVTQPFKHAAWSFVARADEWAGRTQAVNSLWFGAGGESPQAWNTDAPAILDVLGGADAVAGRRALVLGNGATAMSACVALEQAGARVSIAARRPDALLGGAHGDQAPELPRHGWAARAELDHGILVNATPLVDDRVWPADAPLGAEIVLDLAFPATGLSALIARARREGRRALTPHRFWAAQGARQMAKFLGLGAAPGAGDELSAEAIEGELALAGFDLAVGIPGSRGAP